MTYDYLYFQTFKHQNKTLEEAQTVFARKTVMVAGVEFFFWVVGDSHYIGSQELGFYEVCSCKPIPDCNAQLKIQDFPVAEFTTDLDAFEVVTEIQVKPFDPEVLNHPYTLSHDFGPQALTGIEIFEYGYDTLHTYPEFNASVFSSTKFKLKSDKGNA